MMASFSEGLLLGEKVGLDPSVLVEVFPNPRDVFLEDKLYVTFHNICFGDLATSMTYSCGLME